jgi:3-hydroxy-9,10-secoandrosta-1,3,5(10)-triene-9,17-dione monooxygenase
VQGRKIEREQRMASIAKTTEQGAPEGRDLLERAVALRPMLVEQAADTEARRFYDEGIHRAFDEAGFYRSLIPRRYGGLELDMTTWLRLIAELAHGDIQAAWCFTLAAGHALQVASFWDERAQDEIFGDGDFRAASVAACPTPRTTWARRSSGPRAPRRG